MIFHKLPPLKEIGALSHLRYIFLPIYLILPFYMLFPCNIGSLDIAQTVIVFSAVIPLFDSKKIQLPKDINHSCCPLLSSGHDNE